MRCKNAFFVSIYEKMPVILLQILMNAGIRAHVLQVTYVLIQKVHMSADNQSQVMFFWKFLLKDLEVNVKNKKFKSILQCHF